MREGPNRRGDLDPTETPEDRLLKVDGDLGVFRVRGGTSREKDLRLDGVLDVPPQRSLGEPVVNPRAPSLHQ